MKNLLPQQQDYFSPYRFYCSYRGYMSYKPYKPYC